MTAPKRRGRKPTGNARREQFNWRVSPEERALIERAAELANRKPADFARQAAVRAAVDLVAAHEARRAADELTAEAERLGLYDAPGTRFDAVVSSGSNRFAIAAGTRAEVASEAERIAEARRAMGEPAEITIRAIPRT